MDKKESFAKFSGKTYSVDNEVDEDELVTQEAGDLALPSLKGRKEKRKEKRKEEKKEKEREGMNKRKKERTNERKREGRKKERRKELKEGEGKKAKKVRTIKNERKECQG